ncbi:hypothetical protein [Jiella pelagia]|uniref:Uncharacterized protein n=1 Tax=Jiella pelagia TaxID=2986949 RepID=A0ABY7CAE3_9HYPH|nr:hypothetical protein [Jiella pelagia]WAP70760.1 hypothetical protein OH818_12560 [Jiella pelagia]
MASAIEKSLRRALAEGDHGDPDFRIEIYEAAERALLRLESANGMSDEARDRHRRELITAIETIEGDYFGEGEDAGTSDRPSEDRPKGDDRKQTSGDTAAPAVAGQGSADGHGGRAPLKGGGFIPPATTPEAMTLDRDERIVADDADEADDQEAAREPGRGKRFGGKLLGPVIGLLLLFLVGVAAWAVLSMFSADPQNEPVQAGAVDGDLTVADAIRENADVVGEVAVAPEWVDLYTPQLLGEFAASDEAIETVASEGGRTVVRLVQPAEGAAASGPDGVAEADAREIELPISGEAARRFAGQKAQAEIVVGSPDGEPREFTLRCLFGGETVCGRQRFTTALPEENFLFQLEFPPEAVAGGQIAVDPSVGSAGRDLLFYGLRLRPAS